ncbi:M48 family metallopeptidase [Rossellomorea oryzaecorticis]|uniref:M48 family metallopeptidase n=1 Tax=Rossellomorea oryzaecorticis TaxID=1396505 RepID=A0ABW8VQK4_9BACI|nr:M48 family metallopeptidase [[Bacillus] enclensis]MBH9966456.1 M48 family metallopeptidase [[Bacillus] enclensis]QWC24117.1 M48 family metallopeptidase [Bacillus haikouensis]
MVRKWAFRAVLGYLLLGLFLYVYLFILADSSLPDSFKGSSADPATFMNAREIMLSEEFSKIKNLLFFLSTPYEWLFYFLILILGVSRGFEKWARGTAKNRFIQTAVYLFWLSLASFIAIFPLQFISYKISRTYNISTQNFSMWMKDELTDFWVNYLIMFIIVSVLYGLMKKFKNRWWLAAWALSVPFTIFMMFIQPVVIDPLYNDFYPLKDKALEQKILTLADKAEIPADHVFEVDMSEKTNSLNAYVNGVGSNSRIVLWDTTLEQLTDKEILFVMAHEMAHYVEKHIYIGIAIYLVLSFFGLFLASKLMRGIVANYKDDIKVSSVSSLSSLPLFLLLTSMLMFAVSPFSNWISRYQETRADRYAIEMTDDKQAAITSFQKLSKVGLSQVNPPILVKIFRYGHPTMMERLIMLEQYEQEEKE